MLKIKKNQSGISLIEIVVSVGIIAVILLSIALLSTKSLQMAQMAQTRQTAISYARKGIELVRLNRETKPWNTFVSEINNTSIYPINEQIQPNMTRSYSITQDSSDKVLVEVTIIWTDVKGQHTITQTTTLTRWL